MEGVTVGYAEIEINELRKELVSYVKRKFYSRDNICLMADDIVNQAVLDVIRAGDKQQLNFGYLSRVCIHIAYVYFKKSSRDSLNCLVLEDCLNFLNINDVVDEIIEKENAEEIFASLDVLKEIERIIVLQRYYGDYSFSEIANRNGLKLNTVLSHHRRALEKLRPHLADWCDGRNKHISKPIKNNDGTFSKLY